MVHQNSTLIIGAGELGEAIITALKADTRFSPSLLVRPSSVSRYSHFGVPLVPCDISSASVSGLALTLQPFHTVICCTGFTSGRGTQIKLAAAALEAQVSCCLPWQFGVDYDTIGRESAQDLFDEQLDVRDMLRAQHEIDWIIISTGIFTSFVFEREFGVVDLDRRLVRALGGWENRVTTTTAEDIGRMVREVLLAGVRNEVVFVAGDVVSYCKIAEVVEKALGEKVQRELWTTERLRGELEEEPENGMRKYRALFSEGKGVAWDMESTFNAQRGTQMTGLEKYALEVIRPQVA